MSLVIAPVLISIQPPVFDALTAWGIALLALLMATAWIYVLARHRRILGVGAAAFFIIVLIANFAGDNLGWYTRLDIQPSPFVLMNAVILITVFLVSLGYLGEPSDSWVQSLKVEALVALQIFRLPLELLMLRAAYLHIMPIEFSMLGYNLDVLTGLGALLITAYCAWTKSLPLRLIWAWNLLGIACLCVIAVLAILTSPNVHAFGTEPLRINSWVLYFPYSLLPSVLVSLAMLGHVLLTRKLLSQHRLQTRLSHWPHEPKSPQTVE